MDKMVVHLNVLSPGMEDEVLRKLDAAEVVIVDRRRIRHLHLQILSSLFSHMASHVATATPRYSASMLDNATVGCFLLLHVIAALRREHKSGCGSMIANESGPISICVAD